MQTTEDDEGARARRDLEAALALLHEVASELGQVLIARRNGDPDWMALSPVRVREVKTAFALVLEEKGRVQKLYHQEAGVAKAYIIDLERACDEVGRRLSKLRDAGGG
jgi:hypothetical protein